MKQAGIYVNEVYCGILICTVRTSSKKIKKMVITSCRQLMTCWQCF